MFLILKKQKHICLRNLVTILQLIIYLCGLDKCNHCKYKKRKIQLKKEEMVFQMPEIQSLQMLKQGHHCELKASLVTKLKASLIYH